MLNASDEADRQRLNETMGEIVRRLSAACGPAIDALITDLAARREPIGNVLIGITGFCANLVATGITDIPGNHDTDSLVETCAACFREWVGDAVRGALSERTKH